MDNNQNQERPQYANVNLFFKRDKNDALNTAVAAFSGDVFLEKKSGQYGDFVAVELYVTLRDKEVEYYFGKDLVAPDHKVKFEFLLGKHLYDRITQYTPRWGQTVAFMVYDMEIASFTKRDGQTGRSIKCKCCQFNAIGSKKKDLSKEIVGKILDDFSRGAIKKDEAVEKLTTKVEDRPRMKIKGFDGAAATNNAGGQATTGYNGPTSVPGVSAGGFSNYEDDDDGELPF